jgi:regulatory protein
MKQDNVELLVTEIKEISKKRRLVFLNYEPAFALYTSELYKYGISCGRLLEHDVYYDICENVLKKRAAARAMNLLLARDYAREELINKLKNDYYPEQTIEAAVSYVEKFGYIEDGRYAENFIRSKGSAKSRRQIEQLLKAKGVAADIIERACDDYYGQNEDAELEPVLREMRRKIKGRTELSYEEKMKILAYFYRRGFDADIVRKAFDISME